jgi:hypothetical protein
VNLRSDRRSGEPRAEIRGILLNSGDTLVHPMGPAWFPSPAFHRVLAPNGLPAPPADRLEPALAAGMAYLDAHHHLQIAEEEQTQFEEYYAIVLAHLGHPYADRRLDGAVVADRSDDPGIEPFPEVTDVLARLRQRALDWA